MATQTLAGNVSIADPDLMELPIEDRAFGTDPEPWFAKAREKHPWLAKFSHGYLVHGHHEIRDLIQMDDKLHLAVGDVVEIMGATGTPWGDFMQNLVIAKHGDEHRREQQQRRQHGPGHEREIARGERAPALAVMPAVGVEVERAVPQRRRNAPPRDS